MVATKNMHSARRDKKRFHIFFDWSGEDTPISMIQLKAFESALHTYPHATFALIETPMDSPHQLSVDRLHLYTDLDYDITTYTPLSSLSLSLIHSNRTSFDILQKVKFYVSKYIQQRPSRSRPAYHTRMFARLLALYAHGGIYSDFSFFFLSPFMSTSSTDQAGGFYLNSYCLHRSSENELWQVFRPQTFDSWELTNCFTSTLLYVSQAKSPAIECMLDKYNQERFHVCVDSDAFFGGADCVKQVMERCFNAHNIANIFDVSSSVRQHHHRTHPLVNSNPDRNEVDSESIVPRRIVLESFEGDPMLARHRLLADANWTILAEAKVVWLALLHMGMPQVDSSMQISSSRDANKELEMAVITDEIPKDNLAAENALNMTKDMGIVVDIAPKKLDFVHKDSLKVVHDSLLMHLLGRLSNDTQYLVDVYNSIVNYPMESPSTIRKDDIIHLNMSEIGFCSSPTDHAANSSHRCILDVSIQSPILPVTTPVAMVSSCSYCGGEEIAAMLRRYQSQQTHRRFSQTKKSVKPHIWVTHSSYRVPMMEYERSLLSSSNSYSKVVNLANYFPIASSVTRIPLRAYINRSSSMTGIRYQQPNNILVIDVNEELTSNPLLPKLVQTNLHNDKVLSKPIVLTMRYPVERWRRYFLQKTFKSHSTISNLENEALALFRSRNETSSSSSFHLLKEFRSQSSIILRKLLLSEHSHSHHAHELNPLMRELVKAYFHLRLTLSTEKNRSLSREEISLVSYSQISSEPQLIESLLDSVYFPSIYLHFEALLQNQSHHTTDSLLLVNSDLFSSTLRRPKPSLDVSKLVRNKQESLCYVLQGTILSGSQTKDTCSCNASPATRPACPTWDELYTHIQYPSSERKSGTINEFESFPLSFSELERNEIDLKTQVREDLSRPLYQSLVQFFRPFNMLLHVMVLKFQEHHRNVLDKNSQQSMELFVNTTQHWVAPFLCNITYSLITHQPLVNVTQDCLLHAQSLSWERLSQSHELPEKLELWFEEEDLELEEVLIQRHLELVGALNKKENLLHHLLPQRETKEDSGFNTTLGMLNTF